MTQAQDRPGNRGRIGWLRLALALALLGGAGQPTAQAQSAPATNLVFHALSQADAETVREMVAGVLGESGRVWVDRAGNRLIVEAAPDRQALVAQLVRELDVPPLNIRIEVRLSSREQAGERGVGVGGRGRDGGGG